MMIIGLTGKNAAGKGEVGELLQEKGFYFYSLSDVLREALKSRGEEPIRDGGGLEGPARDGGATRPAPPA